MPDYRIDPHLRHDFSPPPNPPPFQTPRASTRGLLRYWWRQLRLWRLRRMVRLGEWAVRHLPRSLQQEAAALRLLVLGLTLIVLFQAVLLILAGPR